MFWGWCKVVLDLGSFVLFGWVLDFVNLDFGLALVCWLALVIWWFAFCCLGLVRLGF